VDIKRIKFSKLSKGKYLKRILLFAFLIRFTVSIPVFLEPSKAKHNDSDSYHQIAINLDLSQGYSNCTIAPFYKDIEITPVYPVFLTAIYKLFGRSLLFVVFLQLILDVLIVWMIFKIAFVFFNRIDASLFAGGLYALSSHALTYSSAILTECLFTFLLVGTIYFIVCIKIQRPLLKAAGVAILWSILVLCRPIALYTLPMLLMLWYAVDMRSESYLNLGKLIVFSTILGILGLYPWMNRNQELSGLYTISSISDYNLYGVNANSIVSKQKGLNEDEHRKEWLAQLDSPLFGQCSGNYEYVKEAREKGLKLIKENLIYYSWIHLSYVPNMFLPELTKLGENWGLSTGNKGTLAVINRDGFLAGLRHYYGDKMGALLVMIPMILIWFIVLISSLLGLIYLFREKRFALLLSLLGILFYYIFLPGPVSTPRFMYPMVPILCILSGFALSEWNVKRSKKL